MSDDWIRTSACGRSGCGMPPKGEWLWGIIPDENTKGWAKVRFRVDGEFSLSEWTRGIVYEDGRLVRGAIYGIETWPYVWSTQDLPIPERYQGASEGWPE